MEFARKILGLRDGLAVPDGPNCCKMENFNEDATAGPVLRSFGCKSKAGMKAKLEEVCWELIDKVGDGSLSAEALPPMLSRLGYRTKLLSKAKAEAKVMEGKPLGRAVMMLDAWEQAFNSPIYNAIEVQIKELNDDMRSGWKNKLVRASRRWHDAFRVLGEYKVLITLDWAAFDRERPDADIQFIVDVIISCFSPKNEREVRLLEAYKVIMRKSLVEKLIILDDGTCLQLRGMVPSGSIWTSDIDTALNQLYLYYALDKIGFSEEEALAYCAGDDNLTGLTSDPGDAHIRKLLVILNEEFGAGIEDEDFMIHRPPYHVTREQAVFPPGVDISQGTSSLLALARWEQRAGPMIVDEEMGLSHRWRFNFFGKPRFLSCYWLEDGKPIRPAPDTRQRLLWPEGIHKTLDDYEAALLGMVVDNPFNDHIVNQMMHRYCIIQEVRRQAAGGLKPEDILWYASQGGDGEEPKAYPTVGYWRRAKGKFVIEELYPESVWIKEFMDFVTVISGLYQRDSRGGVDAWLFMEIIRGEKTLPVGQIGNDLNHWVIQMAKQGACRQLRPIRRFLARRGEGETQQECPAAALQGISYMRDRVLSLRGVDNIEYACQVGARLHVKRV